MKRYILILALISMQANITLPNMWEKFKTNLKSNFQSKMSSMFGYFKFKTAQAQEAVEIKKENKEKIDMVTDGDPTNLNDDFEIIVNYLVDKKKLNSHQLHDLDLVKGVCGNYVRLLHEVRPSIKFRKTIINRGGECIAYFAHFQEIDDYEKFLPPEQWRESEERRRKVYDKYKSGTPGSLTYLFANPVKESAILETKKMCEVYLRGWMEASHFRWG